MGIELRGLTLGVSDTSTETERVSTTKPMTSVPSIINYGVAAGGVASLVYVSTVTITALAALFAHTSRRRRAARDVLALLLGRRQHSTCQGLGGHRGKDRNNVN